MPSPDGARGRPGTRTRRTRALLWTQLVLGVSALAVIGLMMAARPHPVVNVNPWYLGIPLMSVGTAALLLALPGRVNGWVAAALLLLVPALLGVGTSADPLVTFGWFAYAPANGGPAGSTTLSLAMFALHTGYWLSVLCALVALANAILLCLRQLRQS